MIVLDASVVIALLDAGDAHHAAAQNFLATRPGPYFMHPLTVGEVLVGPAKLRREVAVWRDLEAIGVAIADLGPAESLMLARVRADHGIKMPDACVLATAKMLGGDVVTFDERLATAAAAESALHPDIQIS